MVYAQETSQAPTGNCEIETTQDKPVQLINSHFPGIVHFPSVKLGGYDGKASYIEITHKDDSLDYGYMANVKGDPDAKEDSPALMPIELIRNCIAYIF